MTDIPVCLLSRTDIPSLSVGQTFLSVWSFFEVGQTRMSVPTQDWLHPLERLQLLERSPGDSWRARGCRGHASVLFPSGYVLFYCPKSAPHHPYAIIPANFVDTLHRDTPECVHFSSISFFLSCGASQSFCS